MTTINSEGRKKNLKNKILNGLACTAAVGLAAVFGSTTFYRLGYEVYDSQTRPKEVYRMQQIERALNRPANYNVHINRLEDLPSELPRELERISSNYQRLLDERKEILSDESFLKRKKDYESKIEKDMEIPIKIAYDGLYLLVSSMLAFIGVGLYYGRDKKKEDEIETK